MTARDAIFANIRAVRADAASAQEIAGQADACANAMRKTLPALDGSDLAALFTARASAEKVGASVERIGKLTDLPRAVANYLAANNLPADFVLQPEPRLQGLDWRPMRPNENLQTDTILSVGLAACGVAETGSLVFYSAPTAPTLFAYLPIHHLVALDAQSLYLRLDDYAASVKGRAMPRNLNMITGASGTTDIEGVLTRGAHGPRRLHIVLYG
jgi:L-lactate dehydrogenase complex protein LldG